MKRLLVILICLWPMNAFALCVGTNLGVVPTPNTFAGSGGEYNVYDTNEYMQSVNFTVTTGASVGCRYYIVLSNGNSNNASQRRLDRAGGGSLDYNVYTNTSHNILQSTGAYNGGNVISGTFGVVAVGATNNHTLYWSITPGQVVQHETARFEDLNLNLTVYAEFALNIFTPVSKAISFRARSESSVDLSLVDTGGAFTTSDTTQTVDFADLTSGEFLSYDTIIRSNDGYILTVQSQKAQTLRHTAYPAANTSVPYTFTFNGGTVNLSGGGVVQLASSTGLTPAVGTRFPTRFTVGTLSGLERPGNYQDVLTLTLSAN